MSYARFKKDLSIVLHSRGDADACLSDLLEAKLDNAQRIVFERWVEAGRFDELVSWFLTCYDSGSGDHYLYALSESLKKQNNKDLLQKLYRGAINTRQRCFWAWNQIPSAQGADIQIPKLQRETIEAFEQYIRVLEQLGPIDELHETETAFELFKGGKKAKYNRKYSGQA